MAVRIVRAVGARSAAATTLEAGQGPGETFTSECRDVGLVRLVEELLHFLLTDGQPTQARFDTFHGQCEQHEQHREEDDSKSLHTRK